MVTLTRQEGACYLGIPQNPGPAVHEPVTINPVSTKSGAVHRDSDETISHSKAVDKLKEKLAQIGRGHIVGLEQKRVTLGMLAQQYLAAYEVRLLRSLDTAQGRVGHLKDFYGEDTRALAITSARIRKYQVHRRKEGSEAATINRETSALARMFTLA